jgi:hypothetical protein
MMIRFKPFQSFKSFKSLWKEPVARTIPNAENDYVVRKTREDR